MIQSARVQAYTISLSQLSLEKWPAHAKHTEQRQLIQGALPRCCSTLSEDCAPPGKALWGAA